MKLIAKAKARNGQTFAIQKRTKGYSVLKQDAYCWRYVDGGKTPMTLEKAQSLFDFCIL